jgi:hypothetical protein
MPTSSKLSLTVLHSRLRWLSRLSRYADPATLTVLDARCHLLIRTILRQARAH